MKSRVSSSTAGRRTRPLCPGAFLLSFAHLPLAWSSLPSVDCGNRSWGIWEGAEEHHLSKGKACARPFLSFRSIAAFSPYLHESSIVFTMALLNTGIVSLAQLRRVVLDHLLPAGPWRPQQQFPGGSGWQCKNNRWDWDVSYERRVQTGCCGDLGGQAVRCGTCAKQVLPDVKDGGVVLQCYWWGRMNGKPLDAEL